MREETLAITVPRLCFCGRRVGSDVQSSQQAPGNLTDLRVRDGGVCSSGIGCFALLALSGTEETMDDLREKFISRSFLGLLCLVWSMHMHALLL